MFRFGCGFGDRIHVSDEDIWHDRGVWVLIEFVKYTDATVRTDEREPVFHRCLNLVTVKVEIAKIIIAVKKNKSNSHILCSRLTTLYEGIS